jgi:hypothetical protein
MTPMLLNGRSAVDYELFRRFELKNRLFLSLVVWEAIVLGCVAILMLMQRRSLNSENLHKIGFIFGLGMLVVLLVRPLSRLVSRRTGGVLGFIIGLAVPPYVRVDLGVVAPVSLVDRSIRYQDTVCSSFSPERLWWSSRRGNPVRMSDEVVQP